MEYTLSVNTERSVVREALKGIIWTIFFNRLFGPITPSTGEFCGITYPMASNVPDIDQQIDVKVDHLVKQLDRDKLTTSTIKIIFHDKSKKKTGWFSKEDELIWECWKIKVICKSFDDEKNHNNQLELDDYSKDFEANLIKIVDIVDKHKDHIPAITSLESAPFPYLIEVCKTDKRDDEETWGDYIKKIL